MRLESLSLCGRLALALREASDAEEAAADWEALQGFPELPKRLEEVVAVARSLECATAPFPGRVPQHPDHWKGCGRTIFAGGRREACRNGLSFGWAFDFRLASLIKEALTL